MYKFLTAVVCPSILSFMLLLSPESIQANNVNYSPQELFEKKMLELKTNGISHIDGQSIDNLIESSKNIRVVLMPEVQFQNEANRSSETYRASGMWDKSTNTITMSEKHILSSKNGVPWTLVHEYFGVLGVKDNNFSKSGLASVFLFYCESFKNRTGLVHNLDSLETLKEQIQLSSAGGTSGVGGGGDQRIHDYKFLIYSELIYKLDRKKISKKTFNVAAGIIDLLNFEFSDRLSQGEFKLDLNQKIFFFPKNPGYSNHFNTNYTAVEKFVSILIEVSE